MILRTERLELRPVVPSEQAALHRVFTAPGVRRFIFDDEVIPPARTQEIVEQSAALFATRQFGLWGGWRLPPREADLIGFAGLWYFREPPELELLYGVDDRHVGRGFGREMAMAIVHYASGALHLPEINASTDAGHDASRRLLEHLGFSQTRRATVQGLDTVFYRLTARR